MRSPRRGPRGRAQSKVALLGGVIVMGALVPLVASSAQVGAATGALRGQVMTPGGVSHVLASYSVANNRANRVLSTADQNQDEEGTAAQIDNTVFTIDADAGYTSLTGNTFYATTMVPIRSAVPHQSGYPAQFAVVIKYR